MTDKDILISDLNDISEILNNNGYGRWCATILKAVDLLKEQEAVEPTFRQGKDGIFVWACGSCGAYMYHIYDGIDKAKEYAKYCRQCGKAVKWE